MWSFKRLSVQQKGRNHLPAKHLLSARCPKSTIFVPHGPISSKLFAHFAVFHKERLVIKINEYKDLSFSAKCFYSTLIHKPTFEHLPENIVLAPNPARKTKFGYAAPERFFLLHPPDSVGTDRAVGRGKFFRIGLRVTQLFRPCLAGGTRFATKQGHGDCAGP